MLRGERYLPFLETQRPVVQCRRQTETELHQRLLARAVALVHRADLRNGHMRLVDDQQRVRRQVVEQRRRRLAGRLAGEMPRVVFDAVAEADFGHHFQIELGALRQALRFDQFVLRIQLLQPFLQFVLDRFHRAQRALARGRVMRLGVHGVALQLAQRFAGQRIKQRQPLDVAIEQLDPQRLGVGFSWKYVQHFAAHTERAAGQLEFVAGVLQIGEMADQLTLIDVLAHRQDQAQ